MTGPQRIQLKRTKGWRKPDGVLVVARPSVLGNPFKVVRYPGAVEPWHVMYQPHPNVDRVGARLFVSEWQTKADAIRDAVETYEEWATAGPNHYWRVQCFIDDWKLAGRDLACWCPLDQPCHADVLLRLANPVENSDA